MPSPAAKTPPFRLYVTSKSRIHCAVTVTGFSLLIRYESPDLYVSAPIFQPAKAKLPVEVTVDVSEVPKVKLAPKVAFAGDVGKTVGVVVAIPLSYVTTIVLGVQIAYRVTFSVAMYGDPLTVVPARFFQPPKL